MKLHFGRIACLIALLVWALPAIAQAPSGLSLHDALKAALENSPAFGASVSRTASMKEATNAAGALPNPELSVEAENIGGSGPYEDFDGAEITYGVSQLVELPGKRSGRQAVASGYERKSVYDRDAARLDLIQNVVVAYAAAVKAEADLKILENERVLASSVYENVTVKVDAGKEPPIQKKKAAIALSSSEMALERARRSMDTAKTVLANLMGGQADAMTLLPETLPAMKTPLGLAEYAAMIDVSPEYRGFDAMIEAAQSNLSLEKASAVPDPTIGIGVRDFREDDEQALVAGVSFPLPVFDMNRAAIRRAGHDYNAAMLDKADGRLKAETKLAQAYESFVNAYQEHQVLKDNIVPGAENAFRFAQEGYRAGKFPYLDILDAQRTLFEAKKQLNQTMLDYYTAMAEIDRLTAVHAIPEGDKQ